MPPTTRTGRASKPRDWSWEKPGILVKAAASLSTWFTPVGSEAPRAGTHIAYGRYLFYCNVKYEELLDEGGALFLADNGVVLSYNSIHVKYLTFSTRPPHEKDPVGQQWDRRAREEGVPMGTGSSEQGQNRRLSYGRGT